MLPAERREDEARPVRPWGPASPDRRWDAIVIGAGMGGLVAAGILARLGRRVLVLEQHRVPGGLMQSFRRGPWAWDVGLHVVAGLGRFRDSLARKFPAEREGIDRYFALQRRAAAAMRDLFLARPISSGRRGADPDGARAR